MASLAELHEVPSGRMILLAGTPGAGKSTFCHDAVLSVMAMERQVIFVTTEHGPARVTDLLQEKGMREASPGMLNFVDAFSETAGARTPDREDTVGANCEDLTSISLAISKLQDRIPSDNVFLAFDSLTSPYLFNQGEVFRFMKVCLTRFASEGNSVLALMDEGCGKEEDLGAMMSLADGIDDISGPDEHHFRVYESYECCEFEGVGTTMASTLPPMIAGMVKALEHWKGLERDWNAIETKCIGLGDPYCEFKLVPGEIAELGDSLAKDSAVIERAFHERLVHRLMEFMLHGSPLVERPRLGSDFIMEGFEMTLPAMVSDRYRMAFRMGAAKTGKMVGEHMKEAGLEGDEAVQRLVQFLEQCNVGRVTVGETVRIENNCESRMTQFMTTRLDEPLCFFTTGFLNGFFSAIKDQHVKESKCIAVGDPYCEWEFA